MFLQHPMDGGRESDDQQAFASYAQELRQLADELNTTQPERAAACRLGADVLESLAEPFVSWPGA
ncbi:hypothetical protein [Ferruginivarius sediminum]|uniref:Uncharacterized protein n=1 Tax=Ferruginivarius sediminum TaxID=2661937 RepID=A0A369T6A0_9PROT|nr:hypothetical protein [Ferruginivarius sediminum]RDD60851.1 hypothetical protein DRB17_16090 [Ferruginivarius sediminum]